MEVRCAGTKRDGAPCTATVEPPQRFCWWHDPANADKRRRAASKAGKAKPNRELASIKTRLSDLADDVLTGAVDKGVAAVAHAGPKRISGTTPASPVSRATQGAAQQPRKDLTPAQQAMLGWGGTIISALITLVGTIITVRSGR